MTWCALVTAKANRTSASRDVSSVSHSLAERRFHPSQLLKDGVFEWFHCGLFVLLRGAFDPPQHPGYREGTLLSFQKAGIPRWLRCSKKAVTLVLWSTGFDDRCRRFPLRALMADTLPHNNQRSNVSSPRRDVTLARHSLIHSFAAVSSAVPSFMSLPSCLQRTLNAMRESLRIVSLRRRVLSRSVFTSRCARSPMSTPTMVEQIPGWRHFQIPLFIVAATATSLLDAIQRIIRL